ncbi:MAG: helix-hairpin-helix domain-containing protein [Chloroflexi bacterium]|nr:helix-hairpin-helix domain-containing protein [Chloroflexota bacterium]
MTERPYIPEPEPHVVQGERSDNVNRLVQAAAVTGIVALTVVLTLWIARDSESSGVEIFIPTPAPITFQVSGEVTQPGVYSLDGDPRVGDAIDAAGGLTPDADDRRINLALHVRDGAKIVVPSLGPTSGSLPEEIELPGDQTVDLGRIDSIVSSESTTPDTGSNNGSLTGLIDLNTATKDQLILLPGIGNVRADSIIEWRTNNLISSVNDLLAISGIGPATVESIRPHVSQP